MPVLIGVVIDRAVATGDVEQMLLWGARAVRALRGAEHRLPARLAGRASARSRRRATGCAPRCPRLVLSPRGARTDRLPGDVLSIATGDAEAVATVLRHLTFTVVGLVGLVVSAVVLAVIDPLVAVVVLVGVPLVLVVTQVLAPRLAHRAHVRQEAVGRATGLATDLVRGLRPLKGIGAERVAHAPLPRAEPRRDARERRRGPLGGAALRHHRRASAWPSSPPSRCSPGSARSPASCRSGSWSRSSGSRSSSPSRWAWSPTSSPRWRARERRPAGSSSCSRPRRWCWSATARRAPGPGWSLDGVTPRLAARGLARRRRRATWSRVVAEDPADAAALIGPAARRGRAPAAGEVLLGGVPLTELRIEESRRLLVVAEHHVDLFEGTLRSNVDPAGVLTDDRLAAVLAASAAERPARRAGHRQRHARSRAASASGSGWPGRWRPTRRCWCCTTRRPPSTR